jgi:hypothetical protein
MYLHRDNRELFCDVLELTAERQGVAVDIVEKDYYATICLISDNVSYETVRDFYSQFTEGLF